MPREKIHEIYLDGRHYDGFTAGSGDHAFWLSLAREHGDSILELACGTGRVSLPLAQAGYRVTGIDIAESMLAEARKKAKDADLDIEWVQADMRDFDLKRKFSLIILPANALCHLLTLSDFEAGLASVRQHLAPGGRFAVSVFVPKIELLINTPGERTPFAEYDDPDGKGKIMITHSYVYEPDTQIKRIKTHHSIAGEEGETEGELNMRMYFPQELDALIKYNGFTLEHKFGDFEQAAFNAESELQVVVCRAAGDGS